MWWIPAGIALALLVILLVPPWGKGRGKPKGEKKDKRQAQKSEGREDD